MSHDHLFVRQGSYTAQKTFNCTLPDPRASPGTETEKVCKFPHQSHPRGFLGLYGQMHDSHVIHQPCHVTSCHLTRGPDRAHATHEPLKRNHCSKGSMLSEALQSWTACLVSRVSGCMHHPTHKNAHIHSFEHVHTCKHAHGHTHAHRHGHTVQLCAVFIQPRSAP
jgi:hypothetical protein